MGRLEFPVDLEGIVLEPLVNFVELLLQSYFRSFLSQNFIVPPNYFILGVELGVEFKVICRELLDVGRYKVFEILDVLNLGQL